MKITYQGFTNPLSQTKIGFWAYTRTTRRHYRNSDMRRREPQVFEGPQHYKYKKANAQSLHEPEQQS